MKRKKSSKPKTVSQKLKTNFFFHDVDFSFFVCIFVFLCFFANMFPFSCCCSPFFFFAGGRAPQGKEDGGMHPGPKEMSVNSLRRGNTGERPPKGEGDRRATPGGRGERTTPIGGMVNTHKRGGLRRAFSC